MDENIRIVQKCTWVVQALTTAVANITKTIHHMVPKYIHYWTQMLQHVVSALQMLSRTRAYSRGPPRQQQRCPDHERALTASAEVRNSARRPSDVQYSAIGTTAACTDPSGNGACSDSVGVEDSQRTCTTSCPCVLIAILRYCLNCQTFVAPEAVKEALHLEREAKKVRN